MKIDKSVQKTLIITGGIILAIIIVIAFVRYSFYSSTISSAGTATIEVLPDFVTIYFSVDTKGETAAEATDMNSKIVAKMKIGLEAAGVTEDEIKTQNFNVYPTYDYSKDEQEISGYSASHSLRVQIPIEETDIIGGIIDAGVGAGAGISYINYELNDNNQAKYKIEAIKLATADAKEKAEALAEGAGSNLGSLVSISTSEFGYRPWLAVSEDSAKGSSGEEIQTSITPSEQEVSATVVAVFRIR